MNYIGEKIKELRHKNDMTQEKLANYLCVSYQSVSKWETGVTSPDISLIVPLSRLFKVTTDELFGIDNENALRSEFDEVYKNYWLKDMEEMYKKAKQAVAEFPGDFKYLGWLASMEYYFAFDEDYRSGGSLDFFHSMLEKSEKHYETVIENCTDSDIRQKAIYGIILDLKYQGKLDEAKNYAELYPEHQSYNRDMILELCTEGEELLKIRQKIIHTKIKETLEALSSLWQFQNLESIYTKTAIDISEAIIYAAIPDENYLSFTWELYQLYLKRAECQMNENSYDDAIKSLEKAKNYAREKDKMYKSGKHVYTCTIFDEYEIDETVECLIDDSINHWSYFVNNKCFDPVREREDFKALYQK